jgi:hypothetical protein
MITIYIYTDGASRPSRYTTCSWSSSWIRAHSIAASLYKKAKFQDICENYEILVDGESRKITGEEATIIAALESP